MESVIKAIIFDCYGVLVTEGWNAFRDLYAIDEPKRQLVTDLHHAADWGSLPYVEFEQSVAEITGAPLETVRSYLDRNVANVPLFAYIHETLKSKYKIGMLSNAAGNWLDELFTPEQLKLFDASVLSYEIRVGKPDARAYQAICDRLGVALDECVFIDDTERFCTAARELGMQAIWYKDVVQCKAELKKLLA